MPSALLIRFRAPLHPIFVHFTIALTGASLAFDLLARLFDVPSLAQAAWWTLAGAAMVTVFTIGSGVTSRMRLPMEEGEARSFLRAHMALGPMFFGLLLAQAAWRGSIWQAGGEATTWYLAAAGLNVLLMAVQGYLGGELVYRYGAEVEGTYRPLAGGAPRGDRPGRP
jgi:uncharacterized membrane protein